MRRQSSHRSSIGGTGGGPTAAGAGRPRPQSPRGCRPIRAILRALALCVLPTASAEAYPVEMTPDPISTGIFSPLASINVSLQGSNGSPSIWLEYVIEGFFIDDCCEYLLDIGYPSAIVTGVETELLDSPAGGTVSWFNSGSPPVDTATISMTCATTAEDNLCRYRARVQLSELPSSGSIQLMPVTYENLPAVPLLPPAALALLAGSLLGLGTRFTGRSGAVRTGRR